jgi:branched-subunit amino acid ABC-type transport system permease component
MSGAINTAVIISKTLTLLLGGLITYLSYKAYLNTGWTALRALTIGFGAVTVGALLAGILDQVVLSSSPDLSLLIESLFTAIGFGVILYSLYVD